MKTILFFLSSFYSFLCSSQTYFDEILGPITQEQYVAICVFEDDCREISQLLCDFRTLLEKCPEGQFLFGASKERHTTSRIEWFLKIQEQYILENKIPEFENNRGLYTHYYKPNIEHKIAQLLTHLPQR